MALHPTVAAVTARIVEKSRETRADYIRRMDAARDSGAGRAKLSCANWAHAFAGQTIADKLTAMDGSKPNLGIVTAYNDMLSAHQPFETYPALIRQAAQEAGGIAEVAAERGIGHETEADFGADEDHRAPQPRHPPPRADRTAPPAPRTPSHRVAGSPPVSSTPATGCTSTRPRPSWTRTPSNAGSAHSRAGTSRSSAT